MTDRDRVYFTKGVLVGINSCVNQLTNLEKKLAIQVAVQEESKKENDADKN